MPLPPSAEVRTYELAHDLATQTMTLWSHLPEDLLPPNGEETDLNLQLDPGGNLVATWDGRSHGLRGGMAFVFTRSEGGQSTLTGYLHREMVFTVMGGPSAAP